MTPGMIETSLVSTRQQSQLSAAAVYQRNAVRMAADRMKADVIRDLQTVARRLFFSTIDLDSSDRQFLQDFIRPECRYPMAALCRLISISSHSVRPEDREAVPEVLRGWILRTVPAVYDVALVGDLETKAQGDHDVAWRAFERIRDRLTRERAIETGTAHFNGLRAQLDTLHAHRS